jgi:hypothetical protein
MPGFLYNDGAESVSDGGMQTAAIAAGTATDTTVKAGPGRLCRVLVTTTGTNAMQIFDNASGHSGTILGALPANPTVGQVYSFQMPAQSGITVKGDANNPGVTISFN